MRSAARCKLDRLAYIDGGDEGSAADRYRYLRELAFDYAWLLDVFGKAE